MRQGLWRPWACAISIIPVDFECPTDADFLAFRAAIESHPQDKMHVHCIYNARVSAFFYRYAKQCDGWDQKKAAENMESIWRPGEDWADFIADSSAKAQPNRYAGEDY